MYFGWSSLHGQGRVWCCGISSQHPRTLSRQHENVWTRFSCCCFRGFRFIFTGYSWPSVTETIKTEPMVERNHLSSTERIRAWALLPRSAPHSSSQVTSREDEWPGQVRSQDTFLWTAHTLCSEQQEEGRGWGRRMRDSSLLGPPVLQSSIDFIYHVGDRQAGSSSLNFTFTPQCGECSVTLLMREYPFYF